MGNRRSSHSSLEDDSRKGSQTSSNVSTKPRQADKHHSNTKSEPLTTSLNPGPATAESPSPKKQPPDKPPTSAKSRLPDLSKFPEDVRKLLLGHSPGVKMKSQANVVRIYVSSIQDGKWFSHQWLISRSHWGLLWIFNILIMTRILFLVFFLSLSECFNFGIFSSSSGCHQYHCYVVVTLSFVTMIHIGYWKAAASLSFSLLSLFVVRKRTRLLTHITSIYTMLLS